MSLTLESSSPTRLNSSPRHKRRYGRQSLPRTTVLQHVAHQVARQQLDGIAADRIDAGAGISGWRRKSKLCGRPDFVFPRFHVVVFVDGCYWHGCRKCALGSKSNVEYWKPKIAGNMKRDRANSKALKNDGWTVIRIWEHDLKAKPMKSLAKIMRALKPA